jgi:tetratricopeptide (TPR) repeat protein
MQCRAVFALLAVLLIPEVSIAAGSPVEIERRIGEMEIRLQEINSGQDPSASLEVIREMAALDPIHPKPYLRVVLLQNGLKRLNEAREIMEGLGAADGPGIAYGDGVALYLRKRLPEALEAIAGALDRYAAIGHRAGMAACETMLGNIDRQQGRLDEAAGHYRTARVHLEKVQDTLGIASVLTNLARVDRMRGRPELAAAEHRAILRIREELHDVDGQARSLNELGASLYAAGDEEGGADAYGKALHLRREMNDRPGQLSTLLLLAGDEAEAGGAEAAIGHLDGALAIATELDRQADIRSIRLSTGRILAKGGEYGRAREALSALMATPTGKETPAFLAEARYWLALSLRHLGALSEASGEIASALEEAEAAGSRTWKAALLTERGVIRIATGEVVGALEDQEAARDLNRQEQNPRGELTNLNNLAAIHRLMGERERALRDMEDALRIAEELDDRQALARGNNNLGVLRLEAGDASAARDRISAAGALYKELGNARGIAMVRANIAEAQSALGRRRQARAAFASALKGYRRLHDRQGEASTLNQTGAFHLKGGEVEEAERAHREALEIAVTHGLAEEAWRAEAGLAAAIDAAGRQDEALPHAMASLDRVEAIRAGLVADAFKVGFLADKKRLYETAVDLLLRGNSPSRRARDGAFAVVERARARGLLDLLTAADALPEERLPPELDRQLGALRDRISALSIRLALSRGEEEGATTRTALAAAEEELERLHLKIRHEDPRYGSLTEPRPIGVGELLAQLSDGEVLLEFFVGERQAWLWQIDREGSSLRRLPEPPEILRLVSSYIASLERPDSGLLGDAAIREEGARLAAALLPLPLPGGARRLIIVPDGPLHHLPFEALVRDGRYLVQAFEVTVAPSASTLAGLRRDRRKPAPNAVAAFGDPAIGAGDDRFPPLPHARREVERIAALFPPERAVLLTGDEATRKAILEASLDRYRYVHFAAHGWIDGRDLGHSGLILSTGGREPAGALLSVADIFSLRLGAEMVALSACRSGSGEIRGGEGIVGMARAFIDAGARSVLVSLWNVNDASTADLMERLYEGLAGGRPPSEALRAAKLEFIESDRPLRRHPYRWAPFVLVGDGAAAGEEGP